VKIGWYLIRNSSSPAWDRSTGKQSNGFKSIRWNQEIPHGFLSRPVWCVMANFRMVGVSASSFKKFHFLSGFLLRFRKPDKFPNVTFDVRRNWRKQPQEVRQSSLCFSSGKLSRASRIYPTVERPIDMSSRCQSMCGRSPGQRCPEQFFKNVTLWFAFSLSESKCSYMQI